MTRHLARALVVLVVVGTAVGLMSEPASANNALITGGSITWTKNNSQTFTTMNLPLPGIQECSASTGTINASSTGSWTATYTSHFSRIMGAEHYTVTLTMSLGGSITAGGVLTGTSASGMVSYKNNSVVCAHVTTSHCSIGVIGINLTGTSTIPNHAVSQSKTSTVSGDNGADGDFGFETWVVGTEATCGPVKPLDDGSTSLTNIVFHATN